MTAARLKREQNSAYFTITRLARQTAASLNVLLLPMQLVDLACQQKVRVSQSSSRMCGKLKFYLVPTDIDIRVMVHLLRFFRELHDELYGSRKSPECQCSFDTVIRQFPFRNFFQQNLVCFRFE